MMEISYDSKLNLISYDLSNVRVLTHEDVDLVLKTSVDFALKLPVKPYLIINVNNYYISPNVSDYFGKQVYLASLNFKRIVRYGKMGMVPKLLALTEGLYNNYSYYVYPNRQEALNAISEFD